MKERLVVLEGAYNVRDLGGYETKDGSLTKWDRYFRGDGLHELTDHDIKILKEDKHIILDIDLRGAMEVNTNVDRLKDVGGITYTPISLLDFFEKQMQEKGLSKGDITLSKEDMAKMPKSLGELYVMVLHYCQDKMKEVFWAISQAGKGAVIFHCSVGKDRTGMVAALLLNLAGVSDKLILEDYAYSSKTIAPVIKRYETLNQEFLKPFLTAGPESMAMFLDELKKSFGDAAGYLKHIGLDDEAIERIKGTFV